MRASEGTGEASEGVRGDPLGERLRSAGQSRLIRAEPQRALLELQLNRCVFPVQLGHYTLTHYIAGGATGRVYEATDDGSQHKVALKVFRDGGGAETFNLLKREARSLSRISHPNLVAFLEAGVDEGLCYLAMELVTGTELLQYVTHGAPRYVGGRQGFGADLGRLRSALRQLASGLAALHAAGMVHRDLKPSNIVVTGSGRVVVVDFGLCHSPEVLHHTTFAGRPVGTPSYMAPEQLRRGAGTAASDCYAIGVILYEALVGSLPLFADASDELVRLRTESAAPWPSDRVAGVPADLDALCHDLLEPIPEHRPTCAELLERLGSASVPARPRAAPCGDGHARLIGRHHELEVLHSALEACRDHCVVLALGGPAGVGKTALVQHFVGLLAPERHVILAAKCHEREALPNKVLDALMDALVPFLKGLSPDELRHVQPRHVHELVRMFPSLSRVESFSSLARCVTKADEQEQKRRALAALAELLGRVADRFVLVLWIDDLQWGDHDSMELIRQLLSSSRDSNWLCIGSFRSDLRRPEALAQRFLGPLHGVGRAVEIRSLRLGWLPPFEATALARDRLGDVPAAVLEDVVNEAQGSPLLVAQLAGYVRELSASAALPPISLTEVVQARLARLSAAATDVLQLVALAAGPIEQRVIIAAAALQDAAVFHELRMAQFVRTQGRRGRVELYHGALTSAILAQLDKPRLRTLHERLARALLERDVAQYERIALHLEAAGQPHEAAKYLLMDAERSERALAYGRAARLYRLALQCGLEGNEAQCARIAYAHALRESGRGPQAAQAYLSAALSEPDSWRRFELRRRAAQEFLLMGQLDEGSALFKELMPAVRLALPRSRLSTMLSFVVRRLRLRLRGLRFRRRVEEVVPRLELARLDTMWMLGQGLVIYNALLGTTLQAQYVLLALRCGEPKRIARALGLEALCASYAGPEARARVDRLLDSARQIGVELDHPLTTATTALWSAASAYFMGEPRRALREIESAERQLREECAGTAYELATSHLVVLGSLYMLGDFRRFDERCRQAVQEALSRGNLYQAVGLRAHTHLACLIADDVDGARRELRYVREAWPQSDFHMQDLAIFFGEARVRLYSGDGVGACEHLAAMWSDAERSFLLRARLLWVEALSWRARANALAYGQTRANHHRREALRYAQALERQNFLGAVGHGLAARAAVAAVDVDERSAQLWYAAARAYEREHLSFFAAVASYQASQWNDQGGDGAQGESLIAESGVTNLAAVVQMFSGWSGFAHLR